MKMTNEQIEQLQQRVDELVDALDHIARVANSSRTQSRRDRWICLRANCEISSSDEWKTANLPKIIENSRGRELRLRAENQELAATVERLRGVVVNYHDENIAAEEAMNKLWDIHKATPRQNLNAVKREVAREAFIDGSTDAVAFISQQLDLGKTDIDLDAGAAADKYVKTKYPSREE